MPDYRLFIGVSPDAATADALSAFVNIPRNLLPGFRWTGPDQWHVTALFIGSLPEEQLPALHDAIGHIAEQQTRFTLHFDQYSYRFRQKQPAMLWAEYSIHPAFSLLYRQLYAAMSTFAMLEPIRDEVIPHITLARMRKLRKVPFELPERATLPPLPVMELALFSSELHSDGARYTALHTFALAES